MKQLYSPNGKLVIGTADTVNATANVSGWSDTGEPIYAGGSDVDWDSQLTRTNAKGDMLVIDEDGDTWPKAMCELRGV